MSTSKGKLTITMDCWHSYKDARDLFFKSIDRYWPDLNYPMIIACNKPLDGENYKGKVIVCDESLTDSKRHLEALKHTETEFTLLIVEDGLITAPVNNKRLDEIVEYMEKNHIDFCKLTNTPNKRGKKIKDLPFAKKINRRQPYGINYLCGIYRKSFLMELLDSDCKDSWEIEEHLLKDALSEPHGYYDNKILVTDNPLHVRFCIEQGKWSYWAKKTIAKKGYCIESSRKSWSIWHDFFARSKHFASSFFPIRLRFGLKKVLSKIGFKFTSKQ